MWPGLYCKQVLPELHPKLAALAATLHPAPLTPINDPALTKRGIRLSIKRDELLHPILSGNKCRKLKYILDHVLHGGYRGIISMGGAYSNHLHALAYAGRALQLPAVALIRGEPPLTLNPTLQDLHDWGMSMHFLSRGAYRELRQAELPSFWRQRYPDYFWLPEGGANTLALAGVAEMHQELPTDYDWLILACGTGTTLAGLSPGLAAPRRLLGVAAMKHGDFLDHDMRRLLDYPDATQTNWQLALDYHGGGFACLKPALLQRLHLFEQQHGIRLEPVYTGKVLLAIEDLLNQDFFAPGQHLIMLHSGGLQGWRGLSNQPMM